VCLVANTLGYPAGGGHRWAYLNWALGLRAAGSDVLWLETIQREFDRDELNRCEEALRLDLEPYGLAGSLLLYDERRERLSRQIREVLDRPLDLLLTLSYYAPPPVRKLARRTALVDLDPGQTQLWIRAGYLDASGASRWGRQACLIPLRRSRRPGARAGASAAVGLRSSIWLRRRAVHRAARRPVSDAADRHGTGY
jgi:hypothetical protein